MKMTTFTAVKKYDNSYKRWEDTSANNKTGGRLVMINPEAVSAIEDVIVNLTSNMTYIYLSSGLVYLVKERVDKVGKLLKSC
jgi:uncharacterized protein YlzI (FlbEa/FlbD family)